MEHTIFLSIGSNLGDRAAHLRAAIDSLSAKVTPLAESSIYETEPWGYSDQPLFLNMVLKGETGLTPQELLSFLKEIEKSIGRKETFRFGPRLIDLDILFYDALVIDTPDLVIPHPHLTERAFVLVPMVEIASDFVHPILRATMAQLKTHIDESSTKLFQAATI
jgi:2-amino-4-hydroxy-6-hydroxymethyldihydropteridine diphosphokinase